MVMQANRAHTYLGLREKEYHVSGDLKDIYPDFVMMANSFGVKAKRVSKPEELRPAIQVRCPRCCLHMKRTSDVRAPVSGCNGAAYMLC